MGTECIKSCDRIWCHPWRVSGRMDAVSRSRFTKLIDPALLSFSVWDLETSRVSDKIKCCCWSQPEEHENAGRYERLAPDSGPAMQGDGFSLLRSCTTPHAQLFPDIHKWSGYPSIVIGASVRAGMCAMSPATRTWPRIEAQRRRNAKDSAPIAPPPQFWTAFLLGLCRRGNIGPPALVGRMAMFAIGADWRAPGRGILASAFVGTCFATVANVPIYFIGRGFGTPARSVISLTAVTQALVISALIAGAALLWRRMQNLRRVKNRPSRKTRASPEVEAIFEKLDRLMTDEQAQVEVPSQFVLELS
jgi:hypothetical protein